MSATVQTKVQIGQHATPANNFVWERDAATGMLVLRRGTHDVVGDELLRVPNGAKVIERGSNANGEYVKFADGTMICTANLSHTSINNVHGSLFVSTEGVWTYPAPFATGTLPVVYGSSKVSTLIWITGASYSATQGGLRAYYAASTGTGTFNAAAIGRWY